ncbi:MAG TPA: phage portal protein [Verrucomicrobiae bacterium]|nr:phage portal protein [Verrucomicrobiae bacterium]
MTTPAPNPQLTRLLRRLAAQQGALRQLDQYYTGTQPLSFLAPELARELGERLRSMVVNWPRIVVDSLEERLDVEGFRLAVDGPADKDLWRIWQANNMDEGSQLVHKDSFVHGLSFALVWDDPDDPETPKITGESAEQVAVEFKPGTTEVAAAVKHWREDDLAYANVYQPGLIDKYQAQLTSGVFIPGLGQWQKIGQISHGLGVPVVPFINRGRLTRPYGESEITDVVPLVDGINKLATDMMVSAEFHAGIRRWVTGLDLGDGEGADVRASELIRQRWTRAAADKVWAVSDENVRFGQFSEAQLENFIKGIEMFEAQIAAIAGLPPHYVGLMSQANPASADAIRSAEASLVKRARRKHRVLGGSWERVLRLALQIIDINHGGDGLQVVKQSAAMETIWRSPETPTVAQMVDAAQKLDSIGLPLRQNLERLDYTPTQIDRVFQTRLDDAAGEALALAQAADRIVEKTGFSRAAALSMVGLQEAAKVEAIVEARSPGPGVVNDAELAAEVEAATPAAPIPESHAADSPPAVPAA